MAEYLNNLFGGSKSTAAPAPSADADFADFAEAPEPSPVPFSAAPGGATLGGSGPAATAKPYTKWYNVHERHTWQEFRAEGLVVILIAVVLVLHMAGSRRNRAKARSWIRAHAKPLSSEFALVGYSGVPVAAADRTGDELLDTLAAANEADPDALLKEKSLFEYAAYATGRQNVAFVDVRLTLVKRFNPFIVLAENVLSFFFESMRGADDCMEAILYPFDGKESASVPGLPGAAELRAKDAKSSFDGFVWALVNKERMKEIRDDRYDMSITFTKDHAKLPSWLTVMSESAEITETLLTPDLVKAAHSAGELLDYLIVSDQPIDKPKTLDETAPRKRIFLKYRLPSDGNYEPLVPLFAYFLRMTDQLVHSARFRPEVLRKIKAIRDETIKQIQKADEGEKAEERAAERERSKKQRRDAELNALDAKAQKKYLEKEREKEMRKSMKKQTMRA